MADNYPGVILFLGGNGHCEARLQPARDEMRELASSGAIPSFQLRDIPYPGFEGRPRVATFGEFLDDIHGAIQLAMAPAHGPTSIYATGIGGLLALTLRSSGKLAEMPLVLQAPVLWGLERRLMPRLMRLPSISHLMRPLFGMRPFQRAFVHRYFCTQPNTSLQGEFFAGYNACAAAGDLFRWCDPQLLRRLEARFATRPDALRNITVWWGERDRVLDIEELRCTELALEHKWPLRIFPEWGHYPMIDDPEGWVHALSEIDYA